MGPEPSFEDFPTFGTGAAIEEPDPTTFVGGFLVGQVLPAEYLNWLLNKSSENANTAQDSLSNAVAELVTILTAASITPNAGLTNQVLAALNALFSTVGQLASEASTRATADSTLQTNINTETTNRQNADALLAPKASPTFTDTVTVPPAAAAVSPYQKQEVDALIVQRIPVPPTGLSSQVSVSGNVTVAALTSGQGRRYVNISGSSHNLTMPSTGTYWIFGVNVYGNLSGGQVYSMANGDIVTVVRLT